MVKDCVLSSLLLSVSTYNVVVRFDTVKIFFWEITVTPQSLVLSCFYVNNKHGGTTNVLLGDGYVHFDLMCL